MSEISTANCLCWIPVLCSLNIKWLLLLLLPFTVQHQCVEGSDIICGVCCSRAHCGGVATRKKKGGGGRDSFDGSRMGRHWGKGEVWKEGHCF